MKGEEYTFNAIMYLDMEKNLVELVTIESKSSEQIKNKFMHAWLNHSPWAHFCIHDNGGEFIGEYSNQCLKEPTLKMSQNITKSTVQCQMQKNAPDSGKHTKDFTIQKTTTDSKTVPGGQEVVNEAFSKTMHIL